MGGDQPVLLSPAHRNMTEDSSPSVKRQKLDASSAEQQQHNDANIPAPPEDLTAKRRHFSANRTALFKKPTNNSLVEIAKGGKSAKPPIWAMRQAGRYLPEFRQLRSLSSFFEVCKTPRLAAEVTIQPYARFPDLDALIIFSDILVIPVAMGMHCEMIPGQGPTFDKPLEVAEIDTLVLRPNVEETLGYVFDAIHWTYLRMEHKVPIIGFSGAPWTLLAYMIEGSGSKTWNKAKKWIYNHPAESRRILTAITDTIIDYLVAQYDAGASLLQVFDTNAGELPPHIYEEFCVPDLERIATSVKQQRPDVAMTIFAKDAMLEPFNNSKYDVVGVSWKQSPEYARKACPSKVLQGNLDPVILYSDEIESEARKMMKAFGKGRHIVNLGHGMLPDLTPQALERFIKTVKEH